MTEQKLANALVAQLESWNVKYLFGVSGDDILPFLDAVSTSNIKYIGTAHEAGAAFMASYYAKLTGELGVCVASAAGAINLLEGLADAYMDGAPILAVTGQVSNDKIGTPTKQYFKQNCVYGEFSTYSEMAVDAQSTIRLLIRAMSQALLKNSVSHLSIPSNIWSMSVQAEPATKPPLVQGTQLGESLTGDLDRALSLMNKAKNPLILVGSKGASVTEEIKAVATKWGAAVVLAQEAKGLIPDSWENVIGGIGQARIPKIMKDVDCILMVGVASYEQNFLPKVAIIQIQLEPWQINDKYLWDSLAGDFKLILSKLHQGLERYEINKNWISGIQNERKVWSNELATYAGNNNYPIHPAKLMVTLSEVAAKDAIITLDEGAFIHWFDGYFKASNQTILLSSFWRSMGIGVPAAVTAKLHNPEKQVISVVGDGSFLMSLGEFSTAVKYNLPMVVIVVRNHLYGLEKDKAIHKNLNPAGLEVPAVEFGQYALACGGVGFKVEKPEQLQTMLVEALKVKKPTIIDVVCSADKLPIIGNANQK